MVDNLTYAICFIFGSLFFAMALYDYLSNIRKIKNVRNKYARNILYSEMGKCSICNKDNYSSILTGNVGILGAPPTPKIKIGCKNCRYQHYFYSIGYLSTLFSWIIFFLFLILITDFYDIYSPNFTLIISIYLSLSIFIIILLPILLTFIMLKIKQVRYYLARELIKKETKRGIEIVWTKDMEKYKKNLITVGQASTLSFILGLFAFLLNPITLTYMNSLCNYNCIDDSWLALPFLFGGLGLFFSLFCNETKLGKVGIALSFLGIILPIIIIGLMMSIAL